jgi:hypothetical protein
VGPGGVLGRARSRPAVGGAALGLPARIDGVRPGTTIVLGLLLVAILAAAAIQFVIIATR